MNTKTKVSKTKSRAILSILLIAAIIITGAFAFLTAQDSKTNVFTVGNVSIKLTEKFDTDLSGAIDESKEVYDSSAERITLADGKSIVPGQKIIKSPYVENVGTNEAWTYVVVGIPTTNSDSAFRDNKTGETAIAGQEVSITVTAYAIQDKYKNKTTSEDIWNAYISGKEVATFGNVETSSENLSVRVPLFTVLSDDDFDSTTQVVDNSCNNEWTMLSHNIDGKSTNVYRSADGYDYYVFGYNSKLAAPAEGEDSVKTTPVFKGVKLQKDIGGAKPSVLNYYVAEQTGNTAAGETDLLSTNSVPEGYTLLKTEYYMPGSSIPTLYYDETLSKTGYSFDWSIMDDNGEATTNYAYSGMSITGDTNLLAVYTDTVKQDSVSTPNPIAEYTPSGYLMYSIERDDAGEMYANLVGANRNASDYPATETEVIVPNYVKALNNNGEIVLAEGYVENSYVSADEIPTGGVSIPVKKIQLAEWQWDSSTNDYASDEAVALGQIAKKLNIAGTNIESIKFCGDIYQHNITSGFVLEDIGTIPFSCTKLNDKAFYSCVNLKSCNLPNSLTSIGNSAFESCKALEAIELADSVASIGESAFSYCTSLRSVYIPNSVISLGDSAFSYCNKLVNINISEGITSISDYAFYRCGNLTNINIPNSITRIGEAAFNGTGLTNVAIPNSVISIDDWAFGYCDKLTNMGLSDRLKNIGGYAFYNSRLTNIFIPDSVTNIGESAFYYCDELTSIEIPASVTNIGEKAFVCRSLNKITVDENNQIYDSRNDCNAIIETATNTLVRGCNNTIIPNNVTNIGNNAFSYCAKLTSIIIPASVTNIGFEAFYYCRGLKSIIIPDSVTSIGASAFLYSGLSSLTLGKGVTSIGRSSFSGCEFKDITIPEGIINIGEGAFSSCSNLANVLIPSSVKNIGNDAFSMCDSLASITVSEDNANYASKDGILYIKDFSELLVYPSQNTISDLVLPEGLKKIPDSLFNRNKNVKSLSIPSTVTAIGSSIIHPNRVEKIVVSDKNPVYNSDNNCNAIIETSTNTLIQGCKNSIIPQGVKIIGKNAFNTCISLTEITIPDSVTKIETNAFNMCLGLTDVTIPDSVISIDKYAFFGCSYLSNVSIGNGVKEIGYGAFESCGLTSLTIPDGVTVINDRAFYYCLDLTSVTIGNSVISIGSYAFGGAYLKLKSVTLPNSIKTISTGAFSNCPDLQDVMYQGSLSDWSKVNCPPGSFASGVTITCTDGTVTTQ